MSYYLLQRGPFVAGFGAVSGVTFNATQVWADYMAGQSCGNPAGSTAGCTEAKRAVDAIRAALGKLGYGKLTMGVPWSKADQNAYGQWVTDNGLSPSPAGKGMPAQSHMAVMEQQVQAGVTTGSQPAAEYVKVGDEYVTPEQAGIKVSEAGIDWSTWGLIGLGAAGVVAVAIVASKKKKKRGAPPPPRPGIAGPPSAAAARR